MYCFGKLKIQSKEKLQWHSCNDDGPSKTQNEIDNSIQIYCQGRFMI